MTKLYQNIQAIRKERKIKSIRQLEILSGIREGTIKNWKTRLPRCETLIKLATYLGVSIDSLLGVDDHLLTETANKDSQINRITEQLSTLDIDEHIVDIVIKVLQVINGNNTF